MGARAGLASPGRPQGESPRRPGAPGSPLRAAGPPAGLSKGPRRSAPVARGRGGGERGGSSSCSEARRGGCDTAAAVGRAAGREWGSPTREVLAVPGGAAAARGGSAPPGALGCPRGLVAATLRRALALSGGSPPTRAGGCCGALLLGSCFSAAPGAALCPARATPGPTAVTGLRGGEARGRCCRTVEHPLQYRRGRAASGARPRPSVKQRESQPPGQPRLLCSQRRRRASHERTGWAGSALTRGPSLAASCARCGRFCAAFAGPGRSPDGGGDGARV